MNVYWLEQIQGDVPSGDDWLSPSETACQHALRFAKRRADWTLGRWTAKRALAAYLKLPAQPLVLAKIEIHPTASGAPEAFVDERPAAVAISLSHRDGRAICALAQSGVEPGCDLEVVESAWQGVPLRLFHGRGAGAGFAGAYRQTMLGS